LIDGKLRESLDGTGFANINPATEEPLGTAPDATCEDMEAAIGAARRAFDETLWSSDLPWRLACLEQLRSALERELETFREIVIAEAGCPRSYTHSIQVNGALGELDQALEIARNYEFEREIAGDNGTQRHILSREPFGVVGVITAFNYPLFLNLRKIAPALASGNTVVLKPSPETPWSATALGRLIAEQTDIPPGVVNVITSSKVEPVQLLTSDPRVDLITFVGSTVVGRQIMSQASATLKKVVLELGGKSASIILDDADVAQAAKVTAGVGLHSGQGCARLTRFLVARSRYDEAVEVAHTAFEGIRYGDPTDPEVVQGPQISRRQQERVLGYIAKGIDQGARCEFGGGIPAELERGFFVEPTLLVDVDPMSSVAQEEIFGPVAVMIPFDDDDDAVRIANGTIYGLNGAVHGGSFERALGVARRMRSGQVSVNNGRPAPGAPFGGYKHSGLGRDNGVVGFEEHLETKVIGLP
jgi:aldehyde dehydrogenase (NAD+)